MLKIGLQGFLIVAATTLAVGVPESARAQAVATPTPAKAPTAAAANTSANAPATTPANAAALAASGRRLSRSTQRFQAADRA